MKRITAILLTVLLALLSGCKTVSPTDASKEPSASQKDILNYVVLENELYEIIPDVTSACVFDETAEFYPLTRIPSFVVPSRDWECNLHREDRQGGNPNPYAEKALQAVRFQNSWFILDGNIQLTVDRTDSVPAPEPDTNAPTGTWEVSGTVQKVLCASGKTVVVLHSEYGSNVLVCGEGTRIRAHDWMGALYDLTEVPEGLSGCTATAEIHGYIEDDLSLSALGLSKDWELDNAVELTFGVLPEQPPVTATEKPVIYLYPERETEISIRLDYNGVLTCTYPAYRDGWTVTAAPDGTLTDARGQTYNYLYWEGKTDTAYDFSRGFCVAGEDTAAFLEEALEKLGLTRREANEFLVYWLPQMVPNAYNLIAFQTDAYTDSARLTVTPTPDTVLRVFMAWQPLEAPVEIPAQTLTAPARTGFTVVEWGGTIAN